MNPGSETAGSATRGSELARLQRFAAHLVGAVAAGTPNAAAAASVAPVSKAAAGGGPAAHPTVELSNGLAIPAVGFGCALFSLQPNDFSIGGPQGQGDLAPLREKVEQILDAGYVHLDTAHCYHTEIPIGQVLAGRMAAGSLRREDVWITTKTSDPILPQNSYMFDPAADSYQGVLDEFEGCLERLQVDYVDLLLLHWPGPKPEPQSALGVDRPAGQLTPAQADKKRADMWRALEHLYALGQARSIGVSNWTQRHLALLLAPGGCAVVPHMNQLPIFTALQQHELVEYCTAHGIATTAYSPISVSNHANHVAASCAFLMHLDSCCCVASSLTSHVPVLLVHVCIHLSCRGLIWPTLR